MRGAQVGLTIDEPSGGIGGPDGTHEGGQVEEETGEEIVLEPSVDRARPWWADRRLVALLVAAVVVAVLSQVLDSSPQAEIATSALDAPETSRVATTELGVSSPTTSIDRTTTTTTTSTTTSSLDHVSADAPLPVATSTPPPTAPTVLTTTTTTVNPHPWEPVGIEFFQASNWDPEVELLAVNVTGIFDHYVLDFGDGESMVFKSPSPFCNPGYDAGAGWSHDYAEDGVYTATVTVYGSRDCDTPPNQFRSTSATLTVNVPLIYP